MKDLSKSFSLPVYQQKGIFPHAFVSNPNVSLDYKGAVPDFKYFSGITLDSYNEYCSHFKKNKWNLASEAKKYCQLDCISLYQILLKFSENIFKDLNVSLKHAPTTSSLALRSFRTRFLHTTTRNITTNTNTNIPIITGETFDFIKKAYTGGPVDVFIPHGFNVYHYDVNSLYPFVMQKYPMPVGDLTYFVSVRRGGGNINFLSLFTNNKKSQSLKNRPNGFFEVEVETPSPQKLNIPVLQTRIGTPYGIKTLCPLGKWRGVYSSVELYNAMDNFGYKFKVIRGYIYKEEAFVYDQYINYFSNIKINTPKSDPMYLISKLLMNSLYGKTGQNYRFENTMVINTKELLKLIQDPNVEVSSITELDKDLVLVTYLNNSKYESRPDNIIKNFNGSICHAALITASARVEMFNTIKLLTDLGIKVFYMDTDSLFTDKPIPEYLVDATKLGKYKLENIYKEAVFLAPKVYGGILNNGTEIIKVKGLKYNNELTFESLKYLLNKDTSLNFEQEKFFTKIGVGSISLLKQTYTLIPTSNRRELVYKNNILTETKPYVVTAD